MEELNNCLEEIISCIKNSKEYEMCITLKEKMSTNQTITKLIADIKKTQKECVRSNYDSVIEKKLKDLEQELNNIPIYHIYLENLKIVNEKIEYVKESLNDYFQKVLNENS